MQFLPMALSLGMQMYNQNKNKGNGLEKIQTLSPDQQKLAQRMFGILGGGLGQGFEGANQTYQDWMNPNGQAAQNFSQPYMDQFNQQTVPGLAERFAGMGAQGGGLSSSGFGQSLSAASGNLQNQLAALKSQLAGQGAQGLSQNYMGLANSMMNMQPFAYGRRQPNTGFMGGYAQQGFPGLQQGAQGMLDWWGNNGPVMGNV